VATQSIKRGRSYTLDDALNTLRGECEDIAFPINYSSMSNSSLDMCPVWSEIFIYALMDELPMFNKREPMEHHIVITDHIDELDDEVKIL
jgi:hypothetical protein